MSFMQRDIDFRLILLILVVIIAIVGLTIFYQSSAGNIIRKYNKVTEKLERIQDNLTTTTVMLDACGAKVVNVSVELEGALSYQQTAQSEFNTLYQETENTLQETESTLSRTQNELQETEADLSETQTDLSSCETAKTAYEDAAGKADGYAADALERLDACKQCSDVTSCQTCINNAMGDVSAVRNYLNEIG